MIKKTVLGKGQQGKKSGKKRKKQNKTKQKQNSTRQGTAGESTCQLSTTRYWVVQQRLTVLSVSTSRTTGVVVVGDKQVGKN